MANLLKKRNAKSSAPQKEKVVKEPYAKEKQFKKERKETPLKKLYEKKKLRIFGLFFMMLSLLSCIAIVSFFFTWWKDADIVEKEGFLFLFTHNISVSNAMGRVGLWGSYYIVQRGFGIPSLLLCWVGLQFGAWLFFKNYRRFRLHHLSWSLLWMLYWSLAFELLFQETSFFFGGYVGYMVAEWLQKFLGIVGLVSFMVLVFLVYVVWKWDIVLNYEVFRKRMVYLWYPTPSSEGNVDTPKEPNTQQQEMQPTTAGEQVVGEKIENHLPAPTATDLTKEEEATLLNITAVEHRMHQLNIEEPLENAEPVQTTASDVVLDKPQQLTKSQERNPSQNPESQEDLTLTVSIAASKEGDHKQRNRETVIETGSRYKLPPASLLKQYESDQLVYDQKELEENKRQIIQTLKNFSINIQRISATIGPTVTLYEIVPQEGTRISKIKNLEDDIALSLSALGIRIIAPIPGKGTIGIEVPNQHKKVVGLRSLISSQSFAEADYVLPVALGKKIDNENYIVDLAKMPHLLMAGATGQGKSVGLNTLLISLLYKRSPSELKFVLIDPKKVELSLFRNLEKHFLTKLPNGEDAIITDTKQVIHTLNALCIEMDNRYDLLKVARCRNIAEYNAKWKKNKLKVEDGHHFLPYIVLVIDEFADLIMTAGKEVELPIARLAQLARAIGIHLVIATQRPSVNIITGMIKANFPGRIAFKVSSKVDSRTILDAGGAEQLVGKGDMLISQGSELIRLQCAFVDTAEVEDVCEYIGRQPYDEKMYLLPEYEDDNDNDKTTKTVTEKDPLLEEAARLVISSQSGSTSLIQRKMRLGFNRAGRLMDQLEALGIVSPPKGSKPRDVLMQTEAELEHIFS